MELSRFLAKVMGIYFVTVSLAMLTKTQLFEMNIQTFVNNGPVMLMSGFFTLILGIMLVVSHQVWEWSWRLIITLLGWLTFLKGSVILFNPQLIVTMSTTFITNSTAIYAAICFDGILGLLLIYCGFKK